MAQQATERMCQSFEHASHRMHNGYEDAEDGVSQRPAQSLATTFMAGVLTGLCVAMILRNNS